MYDPLARKMLQARSATPSPVDPQNLPEPVPYPGAPPAELHYTDTEAVRRFQRLHKLPVTGRIDYPTWWAAGQANTSIVPMGRP